MFDENLLNYIKVLSLKDKKTLSEKALKTTEEVGELAKAVLPYDSAPGTNHRFSDKYKILEEVADIYLTTSSIAYSLGFTDDEVKEMIISKTKKWAEIQTREENVTFPIPFEIHVSVPGGNIFDINNFKKICTAINVKPIIIELEINNDGIIKDYMTSSKHFGDNRSAFEEAERIANELINNGFDIIRKKIETVPWHPAAPSKPKDIMPKNSYFESHIGVMVKDVEEKLKLSEFVKNVKLSGSLKSSQNFFKKTNDGDKYINMLTYRHKLTNSVTFKTHIEFLKEQLNLNGFQYEKVEVEFCIYDTNISHDTTWIG